MGIRPKLLLVIFAAGVLPVAALNIIGYRMGLRAVEAQLRSDVERGASAIAHDVERQLQEREATLLALARSPNLRDYVRNEGKREPTGGSIGASLTQPDGEKRPLGRASSFAPSAEEALPENVQAEVRALLQNDGKHYAAVACLSATKRPLFRVEQSAGKTVQPLHFQTRDFISDDVKADERVWSAPVETPLRSEVTRESYGPALRYTVPVILEEGNRSGARGVLIVDLKLDQLFVDAASGVGDSSGAASRQPGSPPRLAIMLDRAGNVIYHTNEALKYQPLQAAMPASFNSIVDAMKEGQSGSRVFKSTDGNDWIAAYQHIAPLDISAAVAGDYSSAVGSLSWMTWASTGLILLIAMVIIIILALVFRRMSDSIKRVTEGAVAIAKGQLDQRIEVRSSDETRLLAESFNQMTDRLREQIAREAESRQFQSFMRLSAMLTHDLKNSISALSLIVSNMERRSHQEEFRASAMRSLTEATDKLRALVAKLSEPVRSLSGEFKRPRPVDLVPIIKRSLAATAEPSSSLHEIEVRLPPELTAIADDERMEKVLDNLILNALEAMGTKKGKLTVEAGEAEQGFVFFSVGDTGPGMTEEFQRVKLFHPFATTKAKGVGLGLYTCRELVRALGGRVEVESERGSGALFRVVLPSGQINGGEQPKNKRTA
jgi:signal transduction histidine kinase